jgi:hypothetical protein
MHPVKGAHFQSTNQRWAKYVRLGLSFQLCNAASKNKSKTCCLGIRIVRQGEGTHLSVVFFLSFGHCIVCPSICGIFTIFLYRTQIFNRICASDFYLTLSVTFFTNVKTRRSPLKQRGELRLSGRFSSSCLSFYC